MSSLPYVFYGGRKFSPLFLEGLLEWKRQCESLKIPFVITQGGWNEGVVKASGTIHDKDSVDVSVRDLTYQQVSQMITIGRSLGFAAWFRTTGVAKWGTRAHGFRSYHVHAAPNLWGTASDSAVGQARSYRDGRDGLRANLADLGPGHSAGYRTMTWPKYKAAKQQTTKENTMSEEMVRRVIREEILNRPLTANGVTKSFYEHQVEDIVLGRARSVALGNLRGQLSAVAQQLGVKIDESKAAIIGQISRDLDESIHEAMSEHFPSMHKEEADDIAKSVLDALVVRLTKE